MRACSLVVPRHNFLAGSERIFAISIKYVLDLFKTKVLGFPLKALEASMDQFETANNSEQAWVDAEAKSDSEYPEQEPLPVLTRGQRWLAYATAAAVLLSGLNALVQVCRLIIESLARQG